MLETWEEKSPSPMHAMHMGFGIGALLAPLIANPFLAVTSTELTTTNSSNINMSNETSSSNRTHSQETTIVIEESRVEFAFIIIAILTLIGSIPFWFAQVRKCTLTGSDEKVVPASQRETERKSFKEIVNPAAYTGGSMVWGIVILILIFLIYLNVVGGEHSFGNFIRTYSVDVLKFSKDNASYLNLTYWLFHTLGRFSTFIIARWVPIRYLFFIEISLYLITTVAVYFAASSSQLSLWIFTAVVGFVVSPIYGSGIAYANTQVELRGIMMMCSELSGGLGVAFYVWITGYLYDSYGPRAMLLAMLITGIAVCVSSVLFLAVGYFRGNRFNAINERVFEQQMNVIDDNQSRKSTEPCISAQ